MMRPRHIIPQHRAPEASWPIEQRVWAWVEQCPPRARWWQSVERRVAIYAGIAAALVLIIAETLLGA